MQKPHPKPLKMFKHMEKMGKMPMEPEMEHESDDMEHYAYGGDVHHHYYSGGMVESPDEELGEMDEFDSSGEPHTDDQMEDEEPMEFMNKGGMVKKRMMAKGGMVHPSFAKALMRHR